MRVSNVGFVVLTICGIICGIAFSEGVQKDMRVDMIAFCPEVKAPQIDGMLEESWLKKALRIDTFKNVMGQDPKCSTQIWLGKSKNILYVVAKCYQPGIDKLKCVADKRDDFRIRKDENIEVRIDINNDKNTYFSLGVNPDSVRTDRNCDEQDREVCYFDWNCDYQAAAKRGDGFWTVEMSINLNQLDIPSVNEGSFIRINVSRMDILNDEISAWHPYAVGDPSKFVELYFDPHTLCGLRQRCTSLTEEAKRTLDSTAVNFRLQGSVPENIQSVFDTQQNAIEKSLGVLTARIQKEKSKDVNIWTRLYTQIQQQVVTPLRRQKNLAYLLGIHKSNPQNLAKGYVLGKADSMTKIFREDIYTGESLENIELRAAKNETEAIQILVVPIERDLKFVTCEVTDLTGPQGSKIPSELITWYPVGYVYVDYPSRWNTRSGWWPDQLLRKSHFDIPKGYVQPVWLKVKVPAGIASGKYHGTITVKPADAPSTKIPLHLSVLNFEIPKQQHLKTLFVLRQQFLRSYYGLKSFPLDVYLKWIDFCVEHRVSLELTSGPDFKGNFDTLVQRQMQQGGSVFSIGAAGVWGFDNKSEEQIKVEQQRQLDILKMPYERAVKLGYIDNAYIYLHDEIQSNMYKYAKEFFPIVKKTYPRAPMLLTFFTPDAIEAFGPYVDVWCPCTLHYDKNKDLMLKQVKSGDSIWCYTCCGPNKPFPNLFISQPGILHRMIFWHIRQYDMNGFLYWAIANWKPNERPSQRWPDVPWLARTYGRTTGDGFLTYPGQDLLPISSMRFENILDGLEDYEYFWLIKEKLCQLSQNDNETTAELIKNGQQLLVVPKDISSDLKHYTFETEKILNRRFEMAKWLDQVGKLTKYEK